MRGTRQRRVVTANAIEEENREHVGERHRARDVPVHLLEGDAEDAREEEEAGQRASRDRSSSRASSCDARAARDLRPSTRRRAAFASSDPSRQRACRSRSAPRSRRRRRARRRRRRPTRGSARPRRRRAARAARIGRSAARYSNTLPLSTPLPRPPASGISSSSTSESRCSSSDVRRGAYGISSSRSPSACASAHSRSVERKSPRKRATTSSRPDCCSAVRNGRGSRLPKNDPACVIRKRSRRRVLEPGEVVEVGAVRDRHDRARRVCARASPRRSPRRPRRSRPPGARRAARPRARPAPWRARAALSACRCGCATTESRRSATHARPSPS